MRMLITWDYVHRAMRSAIPGNDLKHLLLFMSPPPASYCLSSFWIACDTGLWTHSWTFLEHSQLAPDRHLLTDYLLSYAYDPGGWGGALVCAAWMQAQNWAVKLQDEKVCLLTFLVPLHMWLKGECACSLKMSGKYMTRKSLNSVAISVSGWVWLPSDKYWIGQPLACVAVPGSTSSHMVQANSWRFFGQNKDQSFQSPNLFPHLLNFM